MTPGVMEEGSLPTEPRPSNAKLTDARWRFTIDGMIEGRIQKLWDKIKQYVETGRHQDDGRGPSDYENYPEESREIVRRRRQPHIHIEKYDEGGGKEPSWRDWVITMVGGLIVLGIGAVIYQLEDLKAAMSASLARQEMDEKRLDRVETRVYRGAP